MSKLEQAGASSTTPSGTARSHACRTASARRVGLDHRHHVRRAPPAPSAAPRQSRPPRGRARAAAPARSAKSPPLNLPPTIATTLSKLSIERAAASMLVAFESLTNRTPPRRADRLHHVLEAGEAFERLRQRRLGGAGQVADRRGRHDVAQHVAAGEVHRGQRQQRHVAFRGALPDEAAVGMDLGLLGVVDAVAHDLRPRLLRHPHGLGAVGVHDRPVLRPAGSRRSASWRRRTPPRPGWRSRWSGEKFSSAAIHGRKVSVASS